MKSLQLVLVICVIVTGSFAGPSGPPGRPGPPGPPGRPGPIGITPSTPKPTPLAQPCCGNSPIYCLNATKDTWLEGSSNKNSYDFLIVAKHIFYNKKRILIQFQDLPTQCNEVVWAKLYLRYYYSHKASFVTPAQAPYLNHTLLAHQLLVDWSETQATSVRRKVGSNWNTPYVSINGNDAVTFPTDTVFLPEHPKQWVEFDITKAARNWNNGAPNYGLLIWSVNEDANGRDVRFYSREHKTYQPRLFVFCNN